MSSTGSSASRPPAVDRILAKLKQDALVAQRQLNAWHDLSLWGFNSRFDHPYLFKYERWVGEKLPESGLAQLIPEGWGALPDLSDRLDPLARWFTPRYRPRNYEEMLDRMYLDLDCYLDSKRRPRTLNWLSTFIGVGIIALVTAAILTMIVQVAAWAYGIVILVFGAFMASIDYLPGSRTSIRRTVNIVSLEWYLRNTYEDPDPELEAQEVDVDWS